MASMAVSDITDSASKRVEDLVRLMEEDRLGYRLERFVSQQRDELSEALTADAFSLAPPQGVSYKELVDRLKMYDAAVLPYMEFFAVGTAYSDKERASQWSNFLEGVATCNQQALSSYAEPLLKMCLYPALLLLYSAGVMAEGRRNWAVQPGILFCPVAVAHYGDRPFVLQTNSFDILSEQAQKQMPGREREYVPLLNHIYEAVKSALLPYFLNESKFAAAFARFEVLLAASYGYADEEEKRHRGSASARFWVPPCRFWRANHNGGTVIDSLIKEATMEGDNWGPSSSGLFSARSDAFVEVAKKVKECFQQQGFW